MIKIKLKEMLIRKIVRFYLKTYEQAKRRERKYGTKPDKRYSRQNMLENAARVCMVQDEDLSNEKIRIVNNPTYEPWKQNGYKAVFYHRWYFAFKDKEQDINGNEFVDILEVLYEGYYTNDNMRTVKKVEQCEQSYEEKKALYESIMKEVAIIVKRAINEIS